MITVSIVTFHTAIEELQKCLQSLTSSHIECIFIIDNSQEHSAQRSPKLNIFRKTTSVMVQHITSPLQSPLHVMPPIIWCSTAMFILHPIALTLSKAIWMSIPMWDN